MDAVEYTEVSPEVVQSSTISLGKTEKGLDIHRKKDEDTIVFNGDFVFGDTKQLDIDEIIKRLNKDREKSINVAELKSRYNELIKDGKIQALDLVIDGMGGHGGGETASAAIGLILFDRLLFHLEGGGRSRT